VRSKFFFGIEVNLFVLNIVLHCLLVVNHFSVVKEEIIDDEALLPSYNGRVVTWVCITSAWNINVYSCLLSFRILGSI